MTQLLDVMLCAHITISVPENLIVLLDFSSSSRDIRLSVFLFINIMQRDYNYYFFLITVIHTHIRECVVRIKIAIETST